MAAVNSTSSKASASGRKRKFDVVRSPDGSKNSLYPIFSPTLSPNKISKSPSSSSPSKKRANLIIKQGANQNNKILRYLQPKRLLQSFDNQGPSSEPVSMPSHDYENKENKILDLQVTLVRLEDDNTYQEHSYCMLHRSPKRLCCNAASEFVVQALEKVILEDSKDPCKRLGIPMPTCLSASGCNHGELASACSSDQTQLYLTMIDANLEVMMIRACYQDLSSKSYPSPAIIRAIFSVMKESADKKTIDIGRSFLKRVILKFPPCTPKMKLYYLSILNTGDLKEVHIPAGLWSLRSLKFFDERLTEVENLIEGLLNGNQLKEKMKMPGIRKIEKPKRFRDSPSPVKRSRRRRQDTYDSSSEDVEEITINMQSWNFNEFSDQAVKKRQQREEAVMAMSNEERIDHAFSRFEVLVDILELDLVIWLSKNADYTKIRDRTVCPIIVLALWRPESDTGFDSVHCRRIFSLYVSAWVLKFHPRHLRTLGRLIGMIAEVTSASEANHGNVHPYSGDSCDNLSRNISNALKNTHLEDLKAKAVQMLKPDWLQMQVSANLLDITPSISSMGLNTLLEPMNNTSMCLWAFFLETLMKIHHIKDAMNLLKQASQGFFQEEFLPTRYTNTSSIQINYAALLREISAFHKLRSQIRLCNNQNNVPAVLLELLTL